MRKIQITQAISLICIDTRIGFCYPIRNVEGDQMTQIFCGPPNAMYRGAIFGCPCFLLPAAVLAEWPFESPNCVLEPDLG